MGEPSSKKIKVKEADENKKKKPLKIEDPISIVVGQAGARKRILSRSLLTSRSTYFANALKASSVKHLELPKDDECAFELFNMWLHEGSIKAPSWTRTDPYLLAWALGDKLGCPNSQDAIMLRIITDYKIYASNFIELRFAYEYSSPGSKLRLWALDELRSQIKKGLLGSTGWDPEDVYFIEIAKDFLLRSLLIGNNDAPEPSSQPTIYFKNPACIPLIEDYAGQVANDS